MVLSENIRYYFKECKNQQLVFTPIVDLIEICIFIIYKNDYLKISILLNSDVKNTPAGKRK